jgi:hypothetical protein
MLQLQSPSDVTLHRKAHSRLTLQYRNQSDRFLHRKGRSAQMLQCPTQFDMLAVPVPEKFQSLWTLSSVTV